MIRLLGLLRALTRHIVGFNHYTQAMMDPWARLLCYEQPSLPVGMPAQAACEAALPGPAHTVPATPSRASNTVRQS